MKTSPQLGTEHLSSDRVDTCLPRVRFLRFTKCSLLRELGINETNLYLTQRVLRLKTKDEVCILYEVRKQRISDSHHHIPAKEHSLSHRGGAAVGADSASWGTPSFLSALRMPLSRRMFAQDYRNMPKKSVSDEKVLRMKRKVMLKSR